MIVEENVNGNGNPSTINGNSKRVNGFLHGSSSSSDACARDGSTLRTYKRRKCGISTSNCKFIDLEKLPCTTSGQSNDKMVNELVDIGLQNNSCEQVCDSKINCHSLLNGSDDGSFQHWRKSLESICQSLCPTENGGGGMMDCVREALRNHPRNMDKDTVNHHDSHAHVQSTGMTNGFSTAAQGFSAFISKEASSGSGHLSVSRQCKLAFFRLVTSEKFASLCKLLSENFHGLKIEKVLDFSPIDSRLKEGAYECTPMLFSSDIQEIWRKLQSIGNEMICLSNNMAELSRSCCHDLTGGAGFDNSSDKIPELSARENDVQVKMEEPDAFVFCTCRQCGERFNGSHCLVCNSCEGMFHVSCIEPTLKEIPLKSWYCANCTASGNVSLHEDCIVCEQLIANCGINGVDDIPISEDDHDNEESSDGVIETGVKLVNGRKRLPCKVCGSMLKRGEEFRVCEHPFCMYKNYHTRCLTNKEMKTFGPRWYCPSCLCRVCLTDKDDDDLVMCDGCDHAYHTYCMNPPRKSIPKGKWFCSKCVVETKAIRKVNKLYEGLVEKKQVKDEGNRVTGISSKKSKKELGNATGGSGGMDMLLSAARTLGDEEFTVHDDGKS